MCANAATLTLGTPVNGTTLGAHNDYDFKNTTCTGSFTLGPDVVYDFTAPAGGSYTFTLTPSGWDGELYLLDSCATAGNGMDTCLAGIDAAGSGGVEQLSLNLATGQDVKLVVDSYGSSSGSFTVRADSVLPGECTNAQLLTLAHAGDSVTFSSFTSGDGGNDSLNCGGLGPERVYLLQPQADVRLEVSLTSLEPDGGMIPVAYVSDTCAFESGELACSGGNNPGDTTTLALNHLASDGGPYFLYLDSRSGTEGAFQATVTFAAPLPPPSNDNCEGTVPAIALNPMGDGGLGGARPYDNSLADDTTQEPSGVGTTCNGTDEGPDQVFAIQLTGPVPSLSVSTTTSDVYTSVYLRRGPSCLDQDPGDGGVGSGTAIACDDNFFGASFTTGPLSAGTYYLWVDGTGQGDVSVSVP